MGNKENNSNWIGDKIDKSYKKSNFETLKDFDTRVITCLHEQCPECHGTGKKYDETFCIHYISCPCIKCTPRY